MKQHATLKQQARAFFNKNKAVVSPAFPKEEVVFNSKGLSHLFYKGSHKVSSRSDMVRSISGV